MTKTETWGVWCEIDGMLGHRCNWLKNGGKLAIYATRDGAEAEACRLNNRYADHPRASFCYSAHSNPRN